MEFTTALEFKISSQPFLLFLDFPNSSRNPENHRPFCSRKDGAQRPGSHAPHSRRHPFPPVIFPLAPALPRTRSVLRVWFRFLEGRIYPWRNPFTRLKFIHSFLYNPHLFLFPLVFWESKYSELVFSNDVIWYRITFFPLHIRFLNLKLPIKQSIIHFNS